MKRNIVIFCAACKSINLKSTPGKGTCCADCGSNKLDAGKLPKKYKLAKPYLSFWSIKPGDPIKIRTTHPDKQLHNCTGTACEQSQHSNGYGMALKVAITVAGKLRKFRLSSEHFALLPKEGMSNEEPALIYNTYRGHTEHNNKQGGNHKNTQQQTPAGNKA